MALGQRSDWGEDASEDIFHDLRLPSRKKMTFIGKQFLLSSLHFPFHGVPLNNSEILLLFAQIHVPSPNLTENIANFIFFNLLSLPQDKSLIFSKLLSKIELKLIS